jgi:hypothetical protein
MLKILTKIFDKFREPFGVYRSKTHPDKFIKVKPLGVNGLLVRKKRKKV